MLSRIHHTTILAFVGAASLFAGCVIVDSTASSTASTASTSGGGTDSSVTATTGAGGAGGTATTGNGGAGGTSTGAGGDPNCVDEKGTGKDTLACDAMNITPTPKGPASVTCEANGGTAGSDPPPGYAVCQHGFKIFTPGSAEYLQGCLGMISVSPADACDPQQVQDCIDKLYGVACPTDFTDKLCTDTGTACTGAGDTFAVDECAYQLKTFNDSALTSYVDCFNNSPADQTCQQAHDNCYGEALTIKP